LKRAVCAARGNGLLKTLQNKAAPAVCAANTRAAFRKLKADNFK